MVIDIVVTVFCKDMGDRKVLKAVGWLKQNNIKYQIQEINEDTFTYPLYLHFLEMTVEGLGEILTKKGDGRRVRILQGEYASSSLTEIYEVILDDPEYLDLPLMIDDEGRTATLGTKRDKKEYDNLTVFRKNEKIVIPSDDGVYNP